MPQFFEGNAQGTSFFAVVKQGTQFGFGRTREDFAHDMTENVDGAVWFVGTCGAGQVVCEEEISGGAGAAFDDG